MCLNNMKKGIKTHTRILGTLILLLTAKLTRILPHYIYIYIYSRTRKKRSKFKNILLQFIKSLLNVQLLSICSYLTFKSLSYVYTHYEIVFQLFKLHTILVIYLEIFLNLCSNFPKSFYLRNRINVK